MTIEEFIHSIQKADLSKISYPKIMSTIKYGEIKIPFTTAIIKKGSIIERGRLNENGEKFYSEFDISYRLDTANILKFGRANKPHQSRFYGALPSKNVPLPRIVLFSELVEQFNNIPDSDFEVNMTIGRWYVKEDFEVADICFSEKYLNVEEIKNRYDFWIQQTQNTEIGQSEYKDLMTFFSNEFSKTDINNHFDYKLNSVYSDIAIYANNLHGVGYPSVKADYQAMNIALTPEAVERFLQLKEVAMFKYIVNKGQSKVIQTHYSNDLGAFNSRFEWNQLDCQE